MLRPLLFLLVATVHPEVCAGDTGAPPPESSSLQSGTKAIPISRSAPKFPADAPRKEGWVVLSYVISAEGTVTNVVVEDVVGPKEFAAAAVKGVKRWTFEPARWQGEPVEQCSNDVSVRFLLSGTRRGATPKHARQINEISQLITSGDLDGARTSLASFIQQDLNNYELGFYHMKMAYLAHVQRQYDLEAYYLGSAALGDRIMGRKTNRELLQMKYAAEVNAKQFAAAIETFDALKEQKEQIEDWQNIEAIQNKLIALRDGPAPVISNGAIHVANGQERGQWSQRLLRRSVEFSNLKGNLTQFELRCDRKHFTDKLSSSKNWSVPDHWGSCTIYVFGEEGASFQLYELSPSSGALPPAAPST